MGLMPINGTEIYVESFGEGAETIIFTHALFFSGQMYAKQIEKLSKKFRCVTVDWRGQGRSAKPLGGFDVDNLARDVVEVIDALDLGPVHWVGLSVGGVCGIRIAAQQPERIKRLIVGGASAESEPIEKVLRYEELLLDGFAKDPELVVDACMNVLYGKPFLEDPTNAEIVAQERKIIVANDGPALARACAPIVRRVDSRHLLSHIKCPTKVIVGELDAANPVAKAQVIASGIEGAELEVFPGIGHQPNVEAPEVLTHAIEEFLSR